MIPPAWESPEERRISVSSTKLGYQLCNHETIIYLHSTFFHLFRHIVELLLTYEASCNAADEKGSSPLHLAAWAGFAPIVDALLTHGPSVANANLTVPAHLDTRNLGSHKS